MPSTVIRLLGENEDGEQVVVFKEFDGLCLQATMPHNIEKVKLGDVMGYDEGDRSCLVYGDDTYMVAKIESISMWEREGESMLDSRPFRGYDESIPIDEVD